MRAEPTSLWRNRSFNLLWGSQTLSELGSNMSKLAFPLLVLALTGSPVQAGVVGTLASIANIGTRMPAGVLVDRVDRRRLMLLCDGLRIAAFAALGLLVLYDLATLLLIALVAVVEAVCRSVFDIAERSVVPQIVPAGQMPDAVARNHVRGSVTGLLGPPLGGLLFGLGRALPFLADALSYLLSFIGVAMVRVPPSERTRQRSGSALHELREGMRFVFTHPFLRAVVLIATPVNLALDGMMFALVLVLRLHGVTPAVIGLAEAVIGVGGLLGALAAGVIRRRMPVRILIIGICWLGVALIGADALVAGMVVSVVPMAMVVFLLPAINSALLGYQAAITPNEMQGRVISVLLTVAGGLGTLGPVLAGLLVHSVGGAGTFLVFAAVMAVGGLAALGEGVRTMRPIEELDQAKPDTDQVPTG
jgi:MFS family permease